MSPEATSITRRDFLNGVAIGVSGTIAGGLLPEVVTAALAGVPAAQDAAGYYPPALTGLRGNHPGSFEGAHRLRDGDFWTKAGNIADTSEAYDLIVVGGGISGLAAAYFYRAQAARARASSFSTTTTISVAMPNAMSSNLAVVWRSSMAARWISTVRGPIARWRTVF